MSGATSILSRLAPSSAERALREFILETVTGKQAVNGHPATDDLRSLPISDRHFGAIVDMMSRGHGQLPWMARDVLSESLDPALYALGKQYPAPQHRLFTSVQQVQDFKEAGFISAFDQLQVERVAELGEFPVSTTNSISFELERGSVHQYGRRLQIARRDIVNDGSARFFANAANALIAASYRAEAAEVFAALEGSTTLRDGDAWFIEGVNQTTAPSVMGAIVSGFEAMADQAYPTGEYVGATPAVLVIPSSWYLSAADLPTDLTMQRLAVFKSPHVSAGYLFAAPEANPVVALAGLTNGVQPTVEVNDKPKMTLDIGLELRVTHPFGVIPLSRYGVVRMVKAP